MHILPREWIYIAALVTSVFALRGLRRVFWLFTLMVLPGTLAHEGCHFLLGLLLRGGPVGFTVFPRREGKGWAMGSVSFNHLRWYNAFFIGMAPLLLLPAAYFLVLWRLRGGLGFTWQEGVAVFLLANLIYASLPSWQDVRVAARSPVGWLLLAGGLVWGWRNWHPSPGPLHGVSQPQPQALRGGPGNP